MSENRCVNCQHFAPFVGSLEDQDEDDVGNCTWSPSGPLPITWRYALREVTSAYAGDIGCPAFERRMSYTEDNQ